MVESRFKPRTSPCQRPDMVRFRARATTFVIALASSGPLAVRPGAQSSTAPAIQPPAAKLPALGADKAITEADCTVEKIGTIPTSAIGEPVAAVTVNTAVWAPPAGGSQETSAAAQCVVDGSMAPVDKSSSARPINFRVVLPGELESPGRPSRRWGHERRHSAADRRRPRPGLRSLRQRFRPSDVVCRPARCPGR